MAPCLFSWEGLRDQTGQLAINLASRTVLGADRGGTSLVQITVFGKPFFILEGDLWIGPTLAQMGYWEPLNTRIIASYMTLHPRGLMVDIGANCGYFSVLAAEASAGAAEVLAYEPHPDLARVIEENARCRHLESLTCHPLAVGERSKASRLMVHRANWGDHRLLPQTLGPKDNEWNFKEDTIPVQVVTLDDHLEGKVPTFMKVDAQGNELNILRGASQTLSRTAEAFWLLIEWTPKMMVVQGQDPFLLPKALHDMGFYVHYADHFVSNSVRPFDLGVVPDRSLWGNFTIDLLCTRYPLPDGAFSPTFLPTYRWEP